MIVTQTLTVTVTETVPVPVIETVLVPGIVTEKVTVTKKVTMMVTVGNREIW